MIKKIIPFLVAIFATTQLIQAQEGWTLRECIEYAIENNITVRRADNLVEQYEITVNTNKWSRLPNLNGSANQSFSWGRAASPVDNTYNNINTANSNFSLSTNVPLFTGMQLPNQYALSKLNLSAVIEDLNKAKDDLALNVASFYVQVLYNLELYNIAREQVALSVDQLDRMEKLFEVGKASPAEVAETKARVAQDELSLIQAENNYYISLLDLSQLLELPTPENFTIAVPDEEPEFKILTPPDEIYLEAAVIRPEIRAAIFRLEGSEKSIRIAKSNFYPQLSLGANLGSSFYTTNGHAGTAFFRQLDNNYYRNVGFNLSIPIFNRFATRNNVRTAQLQQINISLQLEQTKKELYKEIQQAWYHAITSESKYKTSDIAVEANEEAFRLMNEKFENGKATSLEFNEAKLNLMKSLSDKVQAKYEYIYRTKVLDFYKGIPIE